MAEQVNHKCSVEGVDSSNSNSRFLNKSLAKNCGPLLESAQCVKAGAKEYDAKQSKVTEIETELLTLMESAPRDADVNDNFKSSLKAYLRDSGPLFGEPMTGGEVSKQQLDALTTKVGLFHEDAKAAEAARRGDQYGDKSVRTVKVNSLTKFRDNAVNKFKKSSYYTDNKEKFDPVFEKYSKARQEAVSVLQGPALGPSGKKSCADTMDNALDAIHSAAGTDAGILVSQHAYKGITPQDAAKGAQDRLNNTAAGSIKINVVYDLQFKEQCILLSQVSALADYSYALDNVKMQLEDEDDTGAAKLRRTLPYTPRGAGNSPLVVNGESFGFINKLTQPVGMAPFYNMTTAEISSLQPLIRLYRVENANKKGASIKETEIFFDSNLLDSKSVLMDKTKRGFGVGIQSLNIAFEGQDMFAQKRCIKANLTLFAHDFGELLKDRGGFRYIDLALKTGKNIKQQAKTIKSNDDLNFRLKAVFGWTMPPNNSPASHLQNVLKDTFVSVNLTPVTHTFDFDEFGRVKFNIEYLAYIEEHCAKNNYNIFTDAETYSTILRRKLAFESANRTLNCEKADDLKKTVKDIKASDKDAIKLEKQTMHAHLIKELFLQGFIHHLNFNREDLESVIKLGPSHDLVSNKVRRGPGSMNASLSKDLQDSFVSELNKSSADKDVKKEMASALLSAGGDSIQIPFFYLGDLINLIVASMDNFLTKTEQLVKSPGNYMGITIEPDILEAETIALKRASEEFKKFRLVLGPLEIVDHKNENVKYINFADVPISVKYFSEWLTSKLLKKDQALYSLTQFLKDLFNDLIKNYLNDDSCFSFSIKQKVRLFEGVVTSYPQGSRDEITSQIISSRNGHNRLNINTARMPVLNIKGRSIYDKPNPGINNEINYFIFYAGRTQPIEEMMGIRSEDESKGIYHYLLGKDKGLIKNISLNKTDSPGLKEVRFEQEGYDGLHQLRELYDVEIDSYANMTAFPGNYIFVDPLGFAPNLVPFSRDNFDLTDLGVGGYYMVTRASHELGPGFANTKLNAVWVASQAGAESGAIVETGRGANEMKAAKCASKQAKQGKIGTSAAIGDFEFSGQAPPLSGLDDNPEAPPSVVDPIPPSEPGETMSIGFGAGSKL